MKNPKIFDYLWKHFSFIGNQGHKINVLPPKGSYGASICRHPKLRTVCTALPKPDKSCRMATAQWGNVGKIATKWFKMGESRTNIVDEGLQRGTNVLCLYLVLPTYLGCTINPFVLVLHFKIKLF